MLEPDSSHEVFDIGRGSDDAIIGGTPHQFARCTSMRFDVVNVVAESLESKQIVDCLPGNTRKGEMAQKAQQNNFLSMIYVHASWKGVAVPGSDFLRFAPICASCNCLYKPPCPTNSS